MSHEVIGQANYRVEVSVKNGPFAFWRWEDASSTLHIAVYSDRIEHKADENQ